MLVTLDEVKAYVKFEVTDEDLEDPEIAREVEILSAIFRHSSSLS